MFPGSAPIRNPQLAIGNDLCPFERALPPGVIISNDQNADEDKHLDECELSEGKISAHENDCPGQKENCLDIEDQKQHRDDVVPHCESLVRAGFGIDAALVRAHLVLAIFHWPQKSAEDERQHGEGDRKNEKDHHRQICRRWPADSVRCRCL